MSLKEFPKQLFLHDPDNGVYGDCHRTVIACMLGLQPEDVPHFADNDADGVTFNNRIREYLEPLGLVEFTTAYDCTLDELLHVMGIINRRAYYILGGFSKTGTNHSVLCYGGEIVHDPSLTDSGIVGPMDDGFYRVTVLARQP